MHKFTCTYHHKLWCYTQLPATPFCTSSSQPRLLWPESWETLRQSRAENQSHHLFSSAFHVTPFRSCPPSVLLVVLNFWISESLLNITLILRSSSEGCARYSTLLMIFYPKRSWRSNTYIWQKCLWLTLWLLHWTWPWKFLCGCRRINIRTCICRKASLSSVCIIFNDY